MREQRRPPAGLVARAGWAERIVVRRSHRTRLDPGRLRGWPRSQVELPPDPFAAEVALAPGTAGETRTRVRSGGPAREVPPVGPGPIAARHGQDAVPATGPSVLRPPAQAPLPVWERLTAGAEPPGVDVRTFVVTESGRTDPASDGGPAERSRRPQRQPDGETAWVGPAPRPPGPELREPAPTRASDGRESGPPRPDPTGETGRATRPHPATYAQHDPAPAVRHHDAATPTAPGPAPSPALRPAPSRWTSGPGLPAGHGTARAGDPHDATHRSRDAGPGGTTVEPARRPGPEDGEYDAVEIGRLADAVADRLRDREVFDRSKRGAVPWQR